MMSQLAAVSPVSADLSAICRAALERWQEVHDPQHRIERAHLLAAATSARLIDTADGPAFDDAAFGELVAFVAELPW